MGIRGAVKQAGGFLNNVDVTLRGVTFTTIPPGRDAEPGEWMYMVPELQVDGAADSVTQHFFMGAAERYEIDYNGATEITGANGGAFTVGKNTPAGKFIDSLLDANPEQDVESKLPDVEGGEPLSFAGIVGARLRVKQEVDVVGTAKQGKRKVKGADGKTKEYDRTNTVVVTVYSLPSAKSTAKPGGVGAKLRAAAAAKGSDDLREIADAAVQKLIKSSGGDSIPKSKLSVGILRILSGDKQKDAVRKLVVTDEYLNDAADRGVIVYDSDEETVALAA